MIHLQSVCTVLHQPPKSSDNLQRHNFFWNPLLPAHIVIVHLSNVIAQTKIGAIASTGYCLILVVVSNHKTDVQSDQMGTISLKKGMHTYFTPSRHCNRKLRWYQVISIWISRNFNTIIRLDHERLANFL